MEIWKPMPDVPDYEISNLGNMRHVVYKKIRKPTLLKNGYQVFTRMENGKTKTRKVHRLVAKAFLPNFAASTEVDHINRRRADNRVVNLRMASKGQNMANRLLLNNGAVEKIIELHLAGMTVEQIKAHLKG